MTRRPLRSLVVLPDDSAQPLLEAIAAATTSVRVKMFELSDPSATDALIEAHHRGVAVRVMVDPKRTRRLRERIATRRRLQRAGVNVLASSPDFSATHEKSLVVDDDTAFVQTCNWEPEYFTHTRDYAVRTTNRDEVAEIIKCFEADWHRQRFQPSEPSSLIWCPWNGRERFAHFIDRTKESLVVANDRFQDPPIVEHIVRARSRGVKVRVITRPVHSLSNRSLAGGVAALQIMHDAGVRIHKLEHLKLHAKMMVADRHTAIVGSINISVGSFDKRRELAIEITDAAIVDRLLTVYRRDWKRSAALDLSDKGLAVEVGHRHIEQDVVARWRSLAEE
jgi:phosphatidylserine/phosphatidylglycerophosphate/cardiolipin synthase-like enzyme